MAPPNSGDWFYIEEFAGMESRIFAAAVRLAALIAVVPSLVGCGRVFSHSAAEVLMIGFIPSPARSIARQERSAIMLAFSEANRRRALGSQRIVLEDGSSDQDLAVIAGSRSDDETRMGNQLAFLSVSREGSGLALQPMRSLDCPSATTPCDAALAERRNFFAARFRDFVGESPGAEAYIAYAEAESLILASERLMAEGQLTYGTLRRALLFGQFPTLIGVLRYAVPPEMIDELLRENAVALSS
jgi:hypothetical protein